MTYENLQNIFAGVYVFLSLIAFALIFIVMLLVGKYTYDRELTKQNKQLKKELEFTKEQLEMYRYLTKIRYNPEQVYKDSLKETEQ